jgi:hypothetical protein
MKFMYEYCSKYFDTRHLVIAVNPKHIDMYESILLFERLQSQIVVNYDFVNGAPAVGATLDLMSAPEAFRQAYQRNRPERNLHHYFTRIELPNIRFPERPYHTKNDPVMSPALLDHFFNKRTSVFAELDERRRRLLHAIYPEAAYKPVLPEVNDRISLDSGLRRHHRYSLKCPAQLQFCKSGIQTADLEVIDVSRHGFLARSGISLDVPCSGVVCIELGRWKVVTEDATAVRRIDADGGPYYGFHIESPGSAWVRCIEDLGSRDAPIDAEPRACSSGQHDPDWSIHDLVPV